MNYLLDTHTFLWIVEDNHVLSHKVKQIYLDNSNQIYLSVASIWEMAIMISLNKLTIRGQLSKFIDKHALENNIRLLAIQAVHVLPLEALPFHHRDPFDRLLIGQCMREKMSILSKDKTFDEYGIERIWS